MNRPARLLLIEDNEIDRRAFLRLVQQKNLPWNVSVAGSIASARDQLLRGQFDVIVADNHLPDGESPELFREFSDLPFVLVTGTLEEQLALRTLERGADDFLVKDAQNRYLDALPFTIEKTLYRKKVQEEQRCLSRELRETEERFRRFVECVQEYAIYTLSSQGEISTWNIGAERTTGWAATEIIGRHFAVLFPPEAVAAGDPQRELEFARQHGVFKEEGRRIRKDGSWFWADITISSVTDQDGRTLGYSKVTRDVTDRKRADDALRESEANLQLALNAAHFGMWKWDLVAEAVVWSDQCKALFGLSPDTAMTYTRFLQSIHPDDRQRVDEALAQAIQLRSMLHMEVRALLPDGAERHVSLIGRGFYDDSGKALRMGGVAFDVNEGRTAVDSRPA